MRIFWLCHCVEQSYKQVKDKLCRVDFRSALTSPSAASRLWGNCAVSFCWLASQSYPGRHRQAREWSTDAWGQPRIC